MNQTLWKKHLKISNIKFPGKKAFLLSRSLSSINAIISTCHAHCNHLRTYWLCLVRHVFTSLDAADDAINCGSVALHCTAQPNCRCLCNSRMFLMKCYICAKAVIKSWTYHNISFINTLKRINLLKLLQHVTTMNMARYIHWNKSPIIYFANPLT